MRWDENKRVLPVLEEKSGGVATPAAAAWLKKKKSNPQWKTHKLWKKVCNVSNLACILWTLVFSLVQSASQTQAVVKQENKYTDNNSPVKTENMKLSAPKTLKEQLWIIDSKPFLISVWSQKAGAVAVVLSSFGTGWGKKKQKNSMSY